MVRHVPAAATPDSAETEARIEELLRCVAQAAAGRFDEKPQMAEGDAPLDRLTTGLRFMMDDLELARSERQRELERLQELDRLKTEFVNNAAHELATPLTSMRLQIEILRLQLASKTDPESQATLESIERNAQHLTRLSRDLLDASKIQDGRLAPRFEPAQLGAVAEAAVASLRPIAEQQGVQLELGTMPTVEALIDPQRITQVLFNLVHNALKFTPRGGRVSIRLNVRGRDAWFRVEDSGSGFAPDDLPKLFRAFSQVHDPKRAVGGNGLGLFIAKGIVERHGGRIWAESDGPGRGAAFTFTLPL